MDPKNISEAIPGIVDWIKGTAGHTNSFVYTTIMNYVKGDEARGKSYALRLLIHYLGDIHQPMHSISRINKDYPAGDRGGNDFPLPGHYSIKELHAAWDSALYEFHVNDKLVSSPHINWHDLNFSDFTIVNLFIYYSPMMLLAGTLLEHQLPSSEAALQSNLMNTLHSTLDNGPKRPSRLVPATLTMVCNELIMLASAIKDLLWPLN